MAAPCGIISRTMNVMYVQYHPWFTNVFSNLASICTMASACTGFDPRGGDATDWLCSARGRWNELGLICALKEETDWLCSARGSWDQLGLIRWFLDSCAGSDGQGILSGIAPDVREGASGGSARHFAPAPCKHRRNATKLNDPHFPPSPFFSWSAAPTRTLPAGGHYTIRCKTFGKLFRSLARMRKSEPPAQARGGSRAGCCENSAGRCQTPRAWSPAARTVRSHPHLQFLAMTSPAPARSARGFAAGWIGRSAG
jgi:hypothetical protein